MTTSHAAAVPEAQLPPLTDGPHRKRIGLISIVACLGGLLFGYDGLAAQIIADDKRWTLLRRCLPNETMDPRLRAAGRSCCATDNRPRTPWNSRATT